jgi:DNA-binding response OmpR family regulator
MTILILEDEEILGKVLKEKFQEKGYSVVLGTDGEAAIGLARKCKPQLIILDLILPKKDGFEVLKDLKSDFELKHIPVIVLSNLDQDEGIKKAFDLGAIDYIIKTQHPVNEIVEKVRRTLLEPNSSR